MIYTDRTKRAMKLCFKAHEGQFDRGGFPYAAHPLHLAEQMNTETETIVALLHDVVEDTEYTFKDIKKMGFEDALKPLELLTHNSDTPYFEYIEAIKEDPIATKVKLADLKHNMDLARLKHEPTEKDLKRIEKYKKAREILEQ